MTAIKKSKVTLWKTGIAEGLKQPEFLGCVQVVSWKWDWKPGGWKPAAEIVLNTRDVETMQILDGLKDSHVVQGRIDDDYCLQLRVVECGHGDVYDKGVMLAEISSCAIIEKQFPGPIPDMGDLALGITIKGWIECNWEQVIDYFAFKPVKDTTESVSFEPVPGMIGAADIGWLDRLFKRGRGQE